MIPVIGADVLRLSPAVIGYVAAIEGAASLISVLLVGWLARDNSFPTGAFLMTGTGIVPTSDFTLLPGDIVHITIQGIGTLSNPIVQS